MAFFQCNFYSQSLYMNTNIGVIIPTPIPEEVYIKKDYNYFKPGVKYKTIFLFHGAYGDYSDWMRFTGIERYAQAHRVAVVMPSVSNSYYLNMYRGERYLTYVTEELPAFVRTIFPLSDKREDNYTAGLSMGGYGALKVALTKPESFSCTASLSGAIDLISDVKDMLSQKEQSSFRLNDIFANPLDIENTDNDLFYLLKKLLEKGAPIPKLFISCGVDDILYPIHLTAKQKFSKLNLDVHFEEHPGAHDWNYWDKHIQRVLDWLPLYQG
jgi:putative tributyrin esterase